MPDQMVPYRRIAVCLVHKVSFANLCLEVEYTVARRAFSLRKEWDAARMA